mmetsp:Transcript_22390/g.22700  ORF Transcript_22390/g.22700 Transcript_22390/m.22700 type:complete len:113 (-) Transcript_22390:646-984(-)
MIALLGGERRYILSHPDQCENIYLHPKKHPSSRHSKIDWSHRPTLDLLKDYPKFGSATANEVVLQAGDVLYLPQHWFHYIISLGDGEPNFQCNTRSGNDSRYHKLIADCGFQ